MVRKYSFLTIVIRVHRFDGHAVTQKNSLLEAWMHNSEEHEQIDIHEIVIVSLF